MRVVAPAVGPALLGRMGGPAVQLNGESCLLVQVVGVARAAPGDDPCLPPGWRQAVRALDVPDVPALEQGMRAVGNVGERSEQVEPPPRLRTILQRSSQARWRRETAAD
jgi:hypothetical protein